MATDFTPNYNLDKYVATDKPNLRDQYNAAMDKIDAALLSANTNATEAKATTQSFAGDIAAKADQTDLDALGALLPAAQFSAQNTVKDALNAKASNAALQSEANTRASADTTLGNRITQTEHIGRVCVLIGDSYGEGYTPDGTVDGWCARAANYLSQAGIVAKYGYRGGAGLSNDYFLAKLQNVINSMSDAEKIRCDTVVIAGGFNDSNASSVNDGAKKIANYIRDNLPNAKCILSFVGKCVTGRTTGAHVNATMENVINAWKLWGNAAGLNGMGWDTGAIGTLNQADMFSSDYVHPNSTGLLQIAKRIASLVCHGAADDAYRQFVIRANEWQNGDATVYNAKQVLGSIDYRGICNGLMFDTAASPMQEFRFSTPITVNLNTTQSINLAYLRTPQTTGQILNFPCTLILHTTNPGSYKTYQGSLQITKSGFVRVKCCAAEGSNYTSIEVDRVQILLTTPLSFV